MTLEELLKALQVGKEITISAEQAPAIAESLKLAMNSYEQTEKILDSLNNEPEQAPDESIEDVITTPADDFSDEETGE